MIGLALAAAVATAGGDLPKFEFQGHTVGEALGPSNRGTVCVKQPPMITACAQRLSKVGDVPVTGFDLRFADDKLYEVMMSFGRKDYPAIREMLVGKYGEPAGETVEKVQTRIGASFDDHRVSWRFAEGDLKLVERAGELETSAILFTDAAARKRIEDAIAAAAQEKGRKAF